MHTLKLRLSLSNGELWEADRRFCAVNKLHNILIKRAKRLMSLLRKGHAYQDMLKRYLELKAAREPDDAASVEMENLKDAMNTYRDSIGLSKSGLENYCKVFQKRYRHMISSHQAQAEAGRVWKGVENVLFKKGKSLHFRKISDMRTIGNKSENGVKFDPYTMEIDWLGIKASCKVKWDDPYIWESLCMDHLQDLDISYCEIAREPFKNGWHYYVILYIKGDAPDKGKPIGDSTAGIDPGVSTVACVSDTAVFLEELAPDSKTYDREIAKIQRLMDISKRETNPDNYNPDGTVKKKKQRVEAAKAKAYAAADGKPYNPKDYPEWKYSPHYLELQWKLRDMYRRKREYVKQSHRRLADRILEDSKHFIVEKMNFAALAKRSKKAAERSDKETTVTKKDGSMVQVHKFKKKKRFGKSVNAKSPSLFLSILKNKAVAAGGSWMEAKTQEYKASQYRHDTNIYEKVPLSQREKEIGGHTVQRDLYSAFLIRHSVKDGTHANCSRCKKDFPGFCSLHDKKVAEMRKSGKSMKQCFGF